MSDIDDSDEDLLALAGAGDSGSEEETVPQRRGVKRSKRSQDVDDGEDDDEEAEEAEEADEEEAEEDNNAGGKGYEDNSNDDGDDEEERVPYPLEGKYTDYEDKMRIEEMDEMAREELLYNRAQEMNEYHERKYLAQRAAREKTQIQEERSSRSKKVKESTRSTKSSKLSELKKQRDKKARKDAGDSYSEGEEQDEEDDGYEVPDAEMYDDEDDDDGYEVREDYEDYSRDSEWGSSSKTSSQVREATIEDINKIRMGRTQVARFLYYPEFGDVIQNCYARFNIGINRMTSQPTYRMVKILSVEKGRKPYKLENSFVNICAVCSVGTGEPRKLTMDFFSNSPLTVEEYEKYKSYGASVPNSKKVERKFKELKKMATRVLTSQEVKEAAERKQELNKDYVGANAVMLRSELQAKLEIAKQQANYKEVERLEHELSKYQNARKKQTDNFSQYDKLSTLDKVNERNRKRNQGAIRRAEQIAQEKRKQEALAVASGGAVSNPFSRLKTNVRLYYQNIQKEQAEKHKQEEADKKQEDEKHAKIQSKFFDKAQYRQFGEFDNIIKSSVDINISI